MYVKPNHSAVHLKLIQRCKSTIVQYKIKIKKLNKNKFPLKRNL